VTKDRAKLVEDFRPGDTILTAPEDDAAGSSAPVIGRVEEVFVRVAELWNLHVAGRIIRVTREHPFFVWGVGWMPTGDLRVGDWLRCHDGRWVQVEDLCEAGVVETVYNLCVADYHTYFVGSPEWGFSVWAHNADYPKNSGAGGGGGGNGSDLAKQQPRTVIGGQRNTSTSKPGPYGHLDGKDNITIAAGRDFQPAQKKKIRRENKKRNKGVLRSDDPNDPLFGQDLVPPPLGKRQPGKFPKVPDNQAQVDHIIPRIGPDGQPLGTNAYSNAQIISALWNNILRNALK
jgi:hypothetical protein